MPVQKKLLRLFPFFHPLSPADFTRIARAADRKVVPADRVVFEEGTPGETFFMIVSGTVEIYTDKPHNQTLNTLEAGAWFGELSLIDDQPRSASARTLTQCVLLTLPKDEFRWLVATYPFSLFILVSAIQETLRERDRAFLAEAERRVQQLEKLYSTSMDITRHLEQDRALDAIRERAVELLESAGGDLYLYDESQKLLVAQQQDYLTAPACRVGEGCVGRAFTMGQACISNPNRRRASFELAAPILLHEAGEDRALGVLCVYRASDGAPFDDADKTLLELFASQAAIVIENAQLLSLRMEKARRDGELQAAHGVQASLIPKHPPSVSGYQLAAAWHPAREVSGDFYDFIPLPQDRLGIVIADVSDKGMAAALFMASARGILRASANLGGSVREIIERANGAISADASSGMFVTVFFAILDPRSRHLSYVNAGHNNPLLCRAGSESLIELRGHNLALGIIADFEYSSGELELCPQDLILFYTDGVTEATNAADELFGEARLQQVISKSGAESAKHLIRKLNETVRVFTGAHPQSDDITVVALKASSI